MTILTEVEFHRNPRITPYNGQNEAFALISKEFWITADNNFIDFSKIQSSEFNNKSLK
jgi:hypothetical protein